MVQHISPLLHLKAVNVELDIMKKHLYLMAILVVFAVLPLEAKEKQKWDDQPYKYEVNVGWATIMEVDSYSQTFGVISGSSLLDMMYADEQGAVYSAGGFAAEFGLNFRSWFTLAFNASASGIWHESYDNITKRYSTKSGAQVSIMPVARLFWMRKPTFKMYSSFGLGAGFTTYDGKTFPHIAAAIIPVGMQFGDKVYGLIEWGGGANVSMQGVRVGFGVKF